MAVMLTAAKARLNHALTRLDVREAMPDLAHAPVRRWIAPLLATGVAGSTVFSHWQAAESREEKARTLLRDALVLSGVGAGLVAAHRFNRRWVLPVAEGVHNHGHQGAGAAGETLKSTAGRLVAGLRSGAFHSHGWREMLSLETLAAGSIAGGAAGGLFADRLNGEDIRRTGTLKLKEGLFQFLGNVTLCTVAIVGLAASGRGLGKALLSHAGFRARAEATTLRRIEKRLATKRAGLQHVPLSLTEALEQAWHHSRRLPEGARSAALSGEIRHALSHVPGLLQAPESRNRLETLLTELARGRRWPAVRHHLQKLAGEHLRVTVRTALSEGSLAGDIPRLTRQRVLDQAGLLGTLAGVLTGVAGGAWVSNRVNQWLTRALGLPDDPHDVRLFSHARHGLGEGVLGERGLHWWDGVLHLDDWPTALYLSGVHALEPLLGVLYGLSGFLTGTAGTHPGNRHHADRPRRPVLTTPAGYRPLQHPAVFRDAFGPTGL
ncbi:MAG: hypothetical protein AB7P76_03075 [Candidatus Melainabacteria bacterium]